MAEIENNSSGAFDETVSLDADVACVHMSLFHFLREFKRYTGTTPHQYLIRLKIGEAKADLVRTDKTLMKYAYRVGFSDQSHFSRSFKRLVGMSPKQFRAKNTKS